MIEYRFLFSTLLYHADLSANFLPSSWITSTASMLCLCSAVPVQCVTFFGFSLSVFSSHDQQGLLVAADTAEKVFISL